MGRLEDAGARPDPAVRDRTLVPLAGVVRDQGEQALRPGGAGERPLAGEVDRYGGCRLVLGDPGPEFGIGTPDDRVGEFCGAGEDGDASQEKKEGHGRDQPGPVVHCLAHPFSLSHSLY